jgi:hypothetical protein
MGMPLAKVCCLLYAALTLQLTAARSTAFDLHTEFRVPVMYVFCERPLVLTIALVLAFEAAFAAVMLVLSRP